MRSSPARRRRTMRAVRRSGPCRHRRREVPSAPPAEPVLTICKPSPTNTVSHSGGGVIGSARKTTTVPSDRPARRDRPTSRRRRRAIAWNTLTSRSVTPRAARALGERRVRTGERVPRRVVEHRRAVRSGRLGVAVWMRSGHGARFWSSRSNERATASFWRNAGAFVRGRANAPAAGRLVNTPSACRRGCGVPSARTTRRSAPVTMHLAGVAPPAVARRSRPPPPRRHARGGRRSSGSAVRLTDGVAMRASMSALARIASGWLVLVATKRRVASSAVTVVLAPMKRTSPASASATSCRSRPGGGPLAKYMKKLNHQRPTSSTRDRGGEGARREPAERRRTSTAGR